METRSSVSRLATQRQAIGGQARLRLYADLTGLPDDMEVVWIREACLGQDDAGNVEEAMARGLVPATTDLLPNNRPVVLPGREPPSNNLIRRGGQILMVGPKAEIQAQRAEAIEEGHEQIASAQRLSSAKGADLDGKNFIDASRVDDRIERRSAPTRPPRSKFAE
jgi:hypothetical protein